MSDSAGLNRLQKTAVDAKVSDLKVEVFMQKNIITVNDSTKIYYAVQTLAAHKITGAPVVDKTKKLVGVITEHDLLIQTATLDILDIIKYTKNPISIKSNSTMSEVIVIFYTKKLKWLPVVDPSGRVVGIVTRMDVLNKLLSKGK